MISCTAMCAVAVKFYRMSRDHKLIFVCDLGGFTHEMIVHENFCDLFACKANEMVMMIARDLIICIVGDHVLVDDVVMHEKA